MLSQYSARDIDPPMEVGKLVDVSARAKEVMRTKTARSAVALLLVPVMAVGLVEWYKSSKSNTEPSISSRNVNNQHSELSSTKFVATR